MMTNRTPLWERKLLSRIQVRLILWYFCAFLVFEAIVVTTSTLVIRYEVMRAARYTVTQEWTHQLPEAIHRFQVWRRDNGKHAIWMDRDREVVSTWLITRDGRYIAKSPNLITKVGPIRLDSTMADLAETLPSQSSSWQTKTVGQTTILVGVRPVIVDGNFMGDLISAYSILTMLNTVQTLARVNNQIGLASLIVMLLLTVFLSERSLRPIRSALHRQRNFVNDAAHQLRTPITILRGNLELAAAEDDPAAIRQAIADCLAETDYLSRLVGDLSMLARYESGATPLTYANVNISSIAEELVEQFERVAEPKQVKLTCELPDEPFVVIGDATRLRQLLFILLENAVKYNVEGGSIRVALRNIRNDVRILIHDTGIGIPKTDLPHIFDRFYRSARARQFAPGSGIGLAVAASIVEMHHGHMRVASEIGRGTTFTILLPRIPQHRLSRFRAIRPK